jgi:hypothetical protein
MKRAIPVLFKASELGPRLLQALYSLQFSPGLSAEQMSNLKEDPAWGF